MLARPQLLIIVLAALVAAVVLITLRSGGSRWHSRDLVRMRQMQDPIANSEFCAPDANHNRISQTLRQTDEFCSSDGVACVPCGPGRWDNDGHPAASYRNAVAVRGAVGLSPSNRISRLNPSSPLRRITKPAGRTFDLQDHSVRAAVRQALKNVACASGARSRGSAGPIRAKPLYCQFDLPVRRHPIGSYEFFLVLCHLVPDNLYVCRASRL